MRLLLLAWLLLMPLAAAEEPAMYLLTAEPGHNDPSAWYGHSGLLYRNGTDRFFTYRLDLGQGLERVLVTGSGNARFHLEEFTLEEMVADYGQQGREVRLARLDLAPADREALLATMEQEVLDSVEFPYDIFADNCATRIRDLLDDASHGAIRNATAGRSGTVREIAQPFVDHSPFAYFALGMMLSGEGDRVRPAWELTAFPLQLEDAVHDAGLAATSDVILPAGLANEARRPVVLDVLAPVIGVFAGALVAATGVLAWQRRWAQQALAAEVAIIAALLLAPMAFVTAGTLGLLGDLWRGNENAFLLNPLLIGLLPMAIWALRGRPAAWKGLRITALAVAFAALVGLILQPLPAMDQTNIHQMWVFVPLWIGVAVGVLAAEAGVRERSAA